MAEFISGHSYLIAQIFGFTAMGTAIVTYQFNKQRTVNLMLMLVAALWCGHYAFLGLMTPIVMNVINVVRAFVYSQRGKKHMDSPLIPAAFCVSAAVLLIFTWESPWSLLPAAASVFASLANWQKDAKKLRILTVPVCVGWLVYNAVNGSIAGACNETFTLVSLAVAFWRYDRSKAAEIKNKKEKRKMSEG